MTRNEQQRVKFLKNTSPLKNAENKHNVVAPPLFEEEKIAPQNVSLLEESDQLVNAEKTKTIFDADIDTQESKRNLKFWEKWDTNHYAVASIGLAAMLMLYVGLSFYNNMKFSNESSLNATLEVNQPTTNEEDTTVNDIDDSENLIDGDVVDSTTVIEDIQNSSPQSEEQKDITDYFLENYDL